MDTVYERLPQTAWVLGLGLIFGVLIAIPIGTLQAYKQYSWFDNAGTFVTMLGFSVPVFVIGPLFIWLFSVQLGWLPTFYKTTHDVNLTDWSSIWFQIKQLLMPVGVLTLFNAASFGRFTRASVLENLNQGLRSNRPCQGRGRAAGDHPARAAQQHDPGRHAARTVDPAASSAERSSPRTSSG